MHSDNKYILKYSDFRFYNVLNFLSALKQMKNKQIVLIEAVQRFRTEVEK